MIDETVRPGELKVISTGDVTIVGAPGRTRLTTSLKVEAPGKVTISSLNMTSPIPEWAWTVIEKSRRARGYVAGLDVTPDWLARWCRRWHRHDNRPWPLLSFLSEPTLVLVPEGDDEDSA